MLYVIDTGSIVEPEKLQNFASTVLAAETRAYVIARRSGRAVAGETVADHPVVAFVTVNV